jgi:hypothetical protein
MGQWTAETCDIDPGNELLIEKSKLLFESWSAFAKAQGVPPGDQRQLNTNLRARTSRPNRSKHWERAVVVASG